ncbi:MAG: hypothetical protein RLN62_05690 [Rickettsiales bacterium]
MFKVVFEDLRKFLKNHFLASIIMTLAYFSVSKMLVEGAFENPNPLLGYQFFYSTNFVVNIFLFSVILSTMSLIVIHFYEHRKVDTNLFFSELKRALPRFVFGGLFASVVLSLAFYASFLVGKMNLDFDSDLLSVIRSSILVLGVILMLKSMILFFPVLYYEDKYTVMQTFRSCIKRTSWRIVAYYLFIVIIFHWLGFMIYYIFDIMHLFKLMGFGIEDIVQAYIHILIMLSQISIYKNISSRK